MTVDPSANSGQVPGADRRPSAVAELSQAMSGTSALATGLGKFAAFDVGLGSSAAADIVKAMSGTSALAAGLGTSTWTTELVKAMSGTSALATGLGKFAAFDVALGSSAVADMVKAMSGTSAAGGLAEVVERLTPALDEGLDEQQRRAFQIYAATMLVCAGTQLLLTYPTATAIALMALAIVQASWWLATEGTRRLP